MGGSEGTGKAMGVGRWAASVNFIGAEFSLNPQSLGLAGEARWPPNCGVRGADLKTLSKRD